MFELLIMLGAVTGLGVVDLLLKASDPVVESESTSDDESGLAKASPEMDEDLFVPISDPVAGLRDGMPTSTDSAGQALRNLLLEGTEDPDNLNGGAGADTIIGFGGDDFLSGLGGDDILYGDYDHDHIHAGGGHDTAFGGAGNDILIGDAGDDSLAGDAGDDEISGGAGNDSIDGGAGHDTLHGGQGNDTLHGGAGNDWLTGGAGADLLMAGSGIDQLDGGAENDTLIGSGGGDTLNGQDGDDHLILGAGDIGHGGAGQDIYALGITSGMQSTSINGFDAAEDQIVVRYAPAEYANPTLSVEMSADGGRADILLNGVTVSVVTDIIGVLRVEDIILRAETSEQTAL